MKTYATVLAALAMAVTVGCSDQKAPGEPGPAEKVGKQIDQAVEKAGQKTQAAMETVEEKTATAVQKAGDYADEKIKETGKAIEQAGETLQK